MTRDGPMKKFLFNCYTIATQVDLADFAKLFVLWSGRGDLNS